VLPFILTLYSSARRSSPCPPGKMRFWALTALTTIQRRQNRAPCRGPRIDIHHDLSDFAARTAAATAATLHRRQLGPDEVIAVVVQLLFGQGLARQGRAAEWGTVGSVCRRGSAAAVCRAGDFFSSDEEIRGRLRDGRD